MATWEGFAREAPDLAVRVQARLTATKHHVLATLHADGRPRVSGTEVSFHEGDLCLGSMPGARKALDLLRDPRFALHANPGDGSMEGGDAKVAGTAHEVVDADRIAGFVHQEAPPPGSFHLFALDLDEVVLTSLHPEGDRLVIERWTPGSGVSRTERR